MLVHPKIETNITIKYQKYWAIDFEEIEQHFHSDSPLISVLDSETTGLHIIKDKPFMWVFGWLLPEEKRTNTVKGKVFAFLHSPELLAKVISLSKKMKIMLGHNVKYDLHMSINGGIEPEEIYSLSNVSDTMGLCRMSFDAVSERDGGMPLGLKKVSKKLIDPQADIFESEVKKELRRITDEKRKVLIELLKPFKGWGLGKIKEVYRVKKRKEIDIYTLERNKRWIEVPEEIENLYRNWIKEYPPATYADVKTEVMMEYVHGDGIYTLEIFDMTYPTIVQREQEKILEKENKLLLVLLKMEREGMPVNLEYLNTSYELLDKEIQRNYEELWSIVGEYFTVSQDQVIANYFEKITGVKPDTTDKTFLKKHSSNRVSQLVQRLRRLEKWQSTYISRIIEVAQYDGNFYTQYGQFNTVSGRIGSDAQQFPKERILTEEGEQYEKEHGSGKAHLSMEIFCPRRAFVVQGDGYSRIAYFDLSQIELRAQANYTIRLNRPDSNLCRAYMPLNCVHFETGEVYAYKTLKERSRWREKTKDGKSVWIVPETGEHWTPTDVHSETTHNALLELGYTCMEKYKSYTHTNSTEFPPIDEKAFNKVWRYIGKMFNFMRNYGGGAAKASEALEVAMNIAQALVRGWSNTFPEVSYYQKKVIKRVKDTHYAKNEYGRRYYLTKTDKAYKVGNYLVQGSCADMLKEYMVLIDEFLTKNKCKTKQNANIHDELQFKLYDGEDWILPHIKRIMETVDWMLVPVVVDLEITHTTWADKEEVELPMVA